MSRHDRSVPTGNLRTPGLTKSPRYLTNNNPSQAKEDEDEPTDLVIRIKREPLDNGYDGPELNQKSSNGRDDETGDSGWGHTAEERETCDSDWGLPAEEREDSVFSDYPEARREHLQLNTRLMFSPHRKSKIPNSEAVKLVYKASINKGNGKTTDLFKTKKRVIPIKIRPPQPLPLAFTVSPPERLQQERKLPIGTLKSSQAHHLMTLATEADKILKKQKGTEMRSVSEDEDEKISNSDDDHPCSSASDSSGGGMDQALTLIQRRAAEASLTATKGKKSKRKRSQLPDDLKDQTYWERRRKNNEAAKRSRDARRAKEDQIAIRAALLEQENMRLRIEVAALKEETVKLRGMLRDK